MMNLLPPEQKNYFIQVYHERLFVVAVCVGGCAVIISTLFVWGMYVFTRNEHVVQMDILKTRSEQPIAKDGRSTEKDIVEAKNILAMFTSTSAPDGFSDLVMRRVFAEEGNVTVRGIVCNPVKEGRMSVSVQGVALSRTALVDFSVRLEQAGFSGARVPV